MDGDAMIQEIRRLNTRVGIIAASGLNERHSKSQIKPQTADPHLTHLQKPFTARELLWAMKAASGA
jgi:CheY-like chemotaxis protein